MGTYITPNDTLQASDSASIRAAIELAMERGTKRVRIPRRNERTGEDLWIIDETIALPSGIEVLIDDAHLVLAEGKYLNMFTTGDPTADGGRTEVGEVHNVTLHGRGHAVLDGECGVGTFKDYPATLQRCRIGNIFPVAAGSEGIRSDNITFLE